MIERRRFSFFPSVRFTLRFAAAVPIYLLLPSSMALGLEEVMPVKSRRDERVAVLMRLGVSVS